MIKIDNTRRKAWKGVIETISEIAKCQPYTAYIRFTKGYRSKFTYFMRTIEAFEEYVEPIHEVLNEVFLPTGFGHDDQFSEEHREP